MRPDFPGGRFVKMTRWAMDRREAIKHTLIACGGAAVGVNLLSGCAPNPPPCPVGSDPGLSWGPSVLAPVFYGYADYGASVGAPTNVRVYYPSLDGSPQDAPFLC